MILPFTVAALVLTSCSDWLDINTDPGAATPDTEINPGYLFNYAATTHSSNRQGGDFYIPLLIAGQGVADGGFNDYGGWWSEAEYEISLYSTGNTWVAAYASVGTNITQALNFATEQGADNAIAQNKILLAQMFYEVTMIFGDVPCSQALNTDFSTPVFDPQKSVLEYTLKLLDEALAVADPEKDGAITTYDVFYKGKMENWIKLAKSMKLRTLMCMVDKDPSKSALIKILLEEDDFIEAKSGDFNFPFYSAAGTQNPQYRLTYMYTSPPDYYMFFAHNSVLNLMLPYDDPRLPVYFEKGVEGDYQGLETGEDADIKIENGEFAGYISSPVNPDIWQATTPDAMITSQEIKFLQAEAYVRGLGVSQDLSKANEFFHAAVRNALVYWGIENADITAFQDKLPDLSTLSQSDALKAIAAQQWVDFMTRPFEGWVNQRRTLFPELQVPATAPYTGLMHRWIYPDRERQVNPNVPSPLPDITKKMWFER